MNCASCGAPLQSGQAICDACHGLAAPEPRSSPGIAGFKVAHELGAGRFSQTWLVRDEGGSPLVLKLLRRYAPDSATVQRFIAEAQRLSALPGHPSLARPLAAGVHLVSAFFLVYQHGGDTTLADELRQRGRLAPARALELCAQLSEALAVLHLEGLSHLDLKPANVGLIRSPGGEERAVLLDAYTGHLLDQVGLLDGEMPPLSSAAYAAPEPEPDARADLYSLGALLFQLISGRLPVLGTTAEELIEAHRNHPPLSLADAGRAAHPELELILASLLSKEPVQRPANALQLALALRAIVPLAEAVEDSAPPLEIAPEPPEAAAPPARTVRRARKLWPAAALAIAAAVAVAVFVRARSAPRAAPVVAEATPGVPALATAEPPLAPLTPARASDEPARPAPSRYAKSFERAQRALWTNRPQAAISILQPLLALPLTRQDRARAEHMMGDANAKQGKKSDAARWYSRSLQLSQR